MQFAKFQNMKGYLELRCNISNRCIWNKKKTIKKFFKRPENRDKES